MVPYDASSRVPMVLMDGRNQLQQPVITKATTQLIEWVTLQPRSALLIVSLVSILFVLHKHRHTHTHTRLSLLVSIPLSSPRLVCLLFLYLFLSPADLPMGLMQYIPNCAYLRWSTYREMADFRWYALATNPASKRTQSHDQPARLCSFPVPWGQHCDELVSGCTRWV